MTAKTGNPAEAGLTPAEMLKRYFSLDEIPVLEDRFGSNSKREKELPGPRNRYGYRSDEFDDRGDLNIAFFGCGWVEGHGLPRGEMFTDLVKRQVASKSGRSVRSWNFGLSGSGLDYCARIAPAVVNCLKPDLAVVLIPSADRREFFGSDGQRHMCSGKKNDTVRPDSVDADLIKSMQIVADCDHENIAYTLRQLRHLEALFMASNTPWVYSWLGVDASDTPMRALEKAGLLPTENYLGHPFGVEDMVSDENRHPGRLSHRAFSKSVTKWVLSGNITR